MNQINLNHGRPERTGLNLPKTIWLLRVLMASAICFSIPGLALSQETARRPVPAMTAAEPGPSVGVVLPPSSARELRAGRLSDRTFWVSAGLHASLYASVQPFASPTDSQPPRPGK